MTMQNAGNSARCSCGRPFDEGGTCAQGHKRGQNYFVPETEKKETVTKFKCRKIANNCSICGLMFPEGDDICPKSHQIGVYYDETEKTS